LNHILLTSTIRIQVHVLYVLVATSYLMLDTFM
jgi:hypothetical protein